MKVLNLNQTSFNSEEGLSVALGYFDGLHIGHQLVIKEAIEYAKKNGLKSAVMTFSPNPNVILKKLSSEHLITPPTEKVRLLTELGVDYLMILTFNEELASLRAIDFIERYLVKMKVEHVSTGFDFRFGKKGEGSVELLRQYPEKFSLNVTDKKEIEGEKIGATEIKS
ncbi:bifunctional riboflavin kinase/FMN adenylyltransferase, partial [Turicibacter sanguinis]|nr:bifunctional riboflavin kinase/FMN adenylyltransferase [Turicibacter sanguinis]